MKKYENVIIWECPSNI